MNMPVCQYASLPYWHIRLQQPRWEQLIRIRCRLVICYFKWHYFKSEGGPDLRKWRGPGWLRYASDWVQEYCEQEPPPLRSEVARAIRQTASRKATGVNAAGDAGDTPPPNILVGGRQREYPSQYYYVLSDIADQYRLPSVRSASSRFHSAIRRHQFASVRQADSRLTRLVPPTFNSRWRHCAKPQVLMRSQQNCSK